MSHLSLIYDIWWLFRFRVVVQLHEFHRIPQFSELVFDLCLCQIMARGEFGHNDFYPVVMAAAQVTGKVDGKKALLAMIALDEIRGRLAEAGFGRVYYIYALGCHLIHG